VRDQVCQSNQTLGVGLWLANRAVSLDDQQVQRLRDFLNTERLEVFTFNAFPFENFHQPVVKQNVYEPDWTDSNRLAYTLAVARLANRLLPQESLLSISTLPLGWPQRPHRKSRSNSEPTRASKCAENLHHLAAELEAIELATGQRIVVGLEPEPGCLLQSADDVALFFDRFLLDGTDRHTRTRTQRYLGVCHDICHAAVMRESQADALKTYQEHGIFLTKIQVSSGLAAELNAANLASRLDSLREFQEPRYLHQTVVQYDQDPSSPEDLHPTDENHLRFFVDLPDAIDFLETQPMQTGQQAKLTSHFHVPIHLETATTLDTTQADIWTCLRALDPSPIEFSGHFEIETYAWTVSPESVQGGSLATSIAREWKWFCETLSSNNRQNS